MTQETVNHNHNNDNAPNLVENRPVTVTKGWLHSFAAATLLPIGSEPTLLYLLESGRAPWLLWLVASVGNTLGAVVNWGIGRYLRRFQGAAWFPVSDRSLTKAQARFDRFVEAWLPENEYEGAIVCGPWL